MPKRASRIPAAGHQLKVWRQERGLTRQQVVRWLDANVAVPTDASQIFYYEAGRLPSPQFLWGFAACYNVGIGQLLALFWYTYLIFID